MKKEPLVTYEEVCKEVDILWAAGMKPTADLIHDRLGHGSKKRIGLLLRQKKNRSNNVDDELSRDVKQKIFWIHIRLQEFVNYQLSLAHEKHRLDKKALQDELDRVRDEKKTMALRFKAHVQLVRVNDSLYRLEKKSLQDALDRVRDVKKEMAKTHEQLVKENDSLKNDLNRIKDEKRLLDAKFTEECCHSAGINGRLNVMKASLAYAKKTIEENRKEIHRIWEMRSHHMDNVMALFDQQRKLYSQTIQRLEEKVRIQNNRILESENLGDLYHMSQQQLKLMNEKYQALLNNVQNKDATLKRLEAERASILLQLDKLTNERDTLSRSVKMLNAKKEVLSRGIDWREQRLLALYDKNAILQHEVYTLIHEKSLIEFELKYLKEDLDLNPTQ